MEHDLPQPKNNDDCVGNDDDDSNTHIEAVDLAEIGITHLGEALGKPMMDKDQVPIVLDSPIHSAFDPPDIPTSMFSPPRALGGPPMPRLEPLSPLRCRHYKLYSLMMTLVQRMKFAIQH